MIFKQSFIGFFLEIYFKKWGKVSCLGELHSLLDYLVDHEFIDQQKVRHFTIIVAYHQYTREKRFKNKTQTIKAISKNYDLHENTIWNIIKDHAPKYEHLLSE